jgi:hypothetical protein
MERRSFLGGLTAASFGGLLENSFAKPVRPPDSNKTGGSVAGQDSFDRLLSTFQETRFSCAGVEKVPPF